MQRNGIEKENEGIRDWKLMSLGTECQYASFFQEFYILFIFSNKHRQSSLIILFLLVFAKHVYILESGFRGGRGRK